MDERQSRMSAGSVSGDEADPDRQVRCVSTWGSDNHEATTTTKFHEGRSNTFVRPSWSSWLHGSGNVGWLPPGREPALAGPGAPPYEGRCTRNPSRQPSAA